MSGPLICSSCPAYRSCVSAWHASHASTSDALGAAAPLTLFCVLLFHTVTRTSPLFTT
eukprot:CAMPEP_0195587908 /NCGR_PEP_ID=MMETSP0814-20130614/31754_1 /TAXON_ID=97485 /ORGANISM="Prymnesium parvum, Strain Texoma1" /LENGTH=57 /DNA_ID=CAMNT_0040726769 /DNA_START=146 /DNA_END=319 /DNA_ORIENTATION=-